MAAAAWEDDWELCNDDGFVYKRKKRSQDSATVGSASAPDPEAEERQRRSRKKRTLIELRDKYQKEIHHWEYLSNMLRDMEDRKTLPQQRHQPPPIVSSSIASSSSESECRTLIDNLLLQAEAHESIIEDISNLCDVAESICKSQEERFNQSLIDLPVWATPRSLMASLSDI